MTDSYDPRVAIAGEGAPMVLVPGMDGTGLLFYRQVPLLARRFRVATYALRNDTASMDRLVEDLRDVVDAVAGAGGRAVIVGESFGGTLALSFALAHPQRVRELVILNSFPYFAPQLRLRLAWLGLRLLPVGTMGLIRRLTAFRLHSAHTHRAEVRKFLALTAHASLDGYLNRLRILRGYDVRQRLREIEAPVLYLAAEQDHLVPSVVQATAMARRTPRGALRVLDGHGHICLIAPDVDLTAIVEEWSERRASG